MAGTEIGSWIRDSRKAKNWTQAQVGTMLGVPQAQVSQWETGKQSVGDGERRQLEIAFDGKPESDGEREPDGEKSPGPGMLGRDDGDRPVTATTEDAAEAAVAVIEEGMTLDYVTGKPVKDTPKEQVRQRIVRALFHEYGISVEDMVPDFKMKVDRRRKRIDLAIFAPGAEKTVENLRRIAVFDKEPKRGTRGAYKMRTPEQATKEFGLLHEAMAQAEDCRYGLWTNGLEFFFFEKEVTPSYVRFRPIGDWPMGDESLDSRTMASGARLRCADPEMLRTAFWRCYNFIRGNEGMARDAAFRQLLYLIFAKLHDEKRARDEPPRFWAGRSERWIDGRKTLVEEQFDSEGRKAIRARVEPLFAGVRDEYRGAVFRGDEQITLSDRALAFVVAELAKYDLAHTEVDAKVAAYQEIVGANLRGDRGQFFTPRGAVRLMVRMLDPQPGERVMDPACGTGGFLVEILNHLNRRFQAEADGEVGDPSTDDPCSIRDRLTTFVRRHLFGADFDPFQVQAAQMNLMLASSAQARLYHLNSLEFPDGHLPGHETAEQEAGLGTMDVVITNPPFGSTMSLSDPNILRHFELAHVWQRTDDGDFRKTGRRHGRISPEVLFIERSIDWLRPGGRMGIVLSAGILTNPGDEYIRWWILRHCWVLASVDLPVEAFIVEANVNILTSLLFLKKKTREELQAQDLGKESDYQVFMAVAEKVGFDRRGNTLYKRRPDGEEIVEEVMKRERVNIGGESVFRTLRRKQKIVDDDLPRIGDAYAEFRAENLEPGHDHPY